MLGLLALSSWVFPSCAAESYSEDAVKAAYLYRFAGYVEWPDRDSVEVPFTIDVLGAPGIARELRRLLPQHPIHGRLAQVREITSAREGTSSQILFAGAGHGESLREMAPTADRSAILLVTDEEAGPNMGAAINFLTIDRSIRFEVSLTNAERWGLKINADLLGVALRVHGGHRQSAIPCIPVQHFDGTNRRCSLEQQELG